MKHPVKKACLLSVLALILFAAPAVRAQTAAQDESAIRNAINSQEGSWNKADIDGFMQAYENSEETTFIGASSHKGYQAVRDRYKQNYSSPAAMGHLTFSDIDIRLLPNGCGKTELALATGRYKLEGTTNPKTNGVFSLVWRKGPQGWKIIMDHTS